MDIKKYICVCKVGNNPDGSAATVKHRTTDLLSYTKFIDKTWSSWRWFNVYDKDTKEQLASFTKNRRPLTKRL